MCAFIQSNHTSSDMSTTDIIGIIFLIIFALACIITGLALGVWWYHANGAMAALLAWAVYEEDKKQ